MKIIIDIYIYVFIKNLLYNKSMQFCTRDTYTKQHMHYFVWFKYVFSGYCAQKKSKIKNTLSETLLWVFIAKEILICKLFSYLKSTFKTNKSLHILSAACCKKNSLEQNPFPIVSYKMQQLICSYIAELSKLQKSFKPTCPDFIVIFKPTPTMYPVQSHKPRSDAFLEKKL